MKVILNRDILIDNIKKCRKLTDKKGVGLSFMIKSQFLLDRFIRELFASEKSYTTSDVNGFIQYDRDCFVADIWERREGEDIDFFAWRNGNQQTAILNCYCASNVIPSYKQIKEAVEFLKNRNWFVSAGGTVIGYSLYNGYDELRIGEGVLTGYSTVINERFAGCKNPFTIEMDIRKDKGDFVLVNEGFLKLGGFTDTKALFINTDLSGFSPSTIKNGKVVVQPDYYTLLKVFAFGGANDIEYR